MAARDIKNFAGNIGQQLYLQGLFLVIVAAVTGLLKLVSFCSSPKDEVVVREDDFATSMPARKQEIEEILTPPAAHYAPHPQFPAVSSNVMPIGYPPSNVMPGSRQSNQFMGNPYANTTTLSGGMVPSTANFGGAGNVGYPGSLGFVGGSIGSQLPPPPVTEFEPRTMIM
jgi:hypothetical protein